MKFLLVPFVICYFYFFPHEVYQEETTFVNLNYLSSDFIFELKYATEDNFLKEAVYPCGNCYLRLDVARKLVEANKYFIDKGYRIKVFDCYRPLSVQKKMWGMMPDPRYVANPYEGVGSYHNRGGAVDVTLVDLHGNEIDMGSPFDHFSVLSHYDNTDLDDYIIINRKLLREGMEKVGFNGIRTEWWHFSTGNFEVSDQQLCP